MPAPRIHHQPSIYNGPVTYRVTFEVPDQDRIPEVQAEVTRVLDEHTIVHRVWGSGQALLLSVTFAHAVEADSLIQTAWLAAQHITPTEVSVRTRGRAKS